MMVGICSIPACSIPVGSSGCRDLGRCDLCDHGKAVYRSQEAQTKVYVDATPG